jgi:prophage antirepressor-like protein
MTNKLKLFDFYDHVLRVFPDENGELWFVAKDVAEILEYSDAEALTRKLDEDEVQNRQIAGFGNRGVNLINESGLYSATLSSQKPQAKNFKRWVTQEVLPSIRKTGNYTASDPIQHTTSANKAFNMLPGAMRAARELGLNPSTAIMKANQAVAEITGTDVMNLFKLTQQDIETREQGDPDKESVE